MTLKEIKAMFAPGQTWQAHRDSPPIVIHGNLATTKLLDQQPDTLRKVVKAGSKDLVWQIGAGGDQKKLYTGWPKAAEINEARPGFLRFTYNNGTVVTLTKVS